MKITILSLFDACMLSKSKEMTFVESPQERWFYLSGHWDLRTCSDVFLTPKYLHAFLADFIGMRVTYVEIPEDSEVSKNLVLPKPDLSAHQKEFISEIHALIDLGIAKIVYDASTMSFNKFLALSKFQSNTLQ